MCLTLGAMNSTGYAADDESEDINVEDITPEMLARTLPPQVSDNDEDAESEDDDAAAATVNQQATSTVAPLAPPDTKILDLIRTLETDADRAQLVATLKTLVQTNTLASQQFMFVNLVVGIKDFLRSIATEFKTFTNGLSHLNTWQFSIDTNVLKKTEQAKFLTLAYIIFGALLVQATLVKLIGGAIPPFFGRLNHHINLKTLMRTLAGLLIFVLVGYALKSYFIKDLDTQAYIEDSLLTILIAQVGFLLLRLSIATGILPVNPEYRKSLFGIVLTLTLLWGGYSYVSNLLLATQQVAVVTRPVSQLLLGFLTIVGVWLIHRYRHVIEGMLFRPSAVNGNRLLGGVQQVISGCVHYVVLLAVTMMYLAWFIQNQGMLKYFQDQLGITLISLLILSIAAYVMESSSRYLIAADNEHIVRASSVSHRLIDILAFITIVHLIYRWLAPLAEMQGISTSKMSDKLFGIFIIIALAVLVIYGLNRIFNSSNKMLSHNKQLKTFVPIIDRLSKLVVFVVTGLLLLIELNVNVMPIVASFSVLGLGIGLASKSIIEDFMNGLLIIQENDFSIGDKITIGGITGTIENITLRKLHLRDSKGFMNYIPFSNVGAITNQSRDYNDEKVIIPLPSTFHLKRTVHILEDVGKQLLHDPELQPYIISVPKFVGVSEFQMSTHQGAEITTMMQFDIKTVPGKMSLVAGEFRKLAKLAFEEMERVI
jgi:small-conductance mechanosensitive channel